MVLLFQFLFQHTGQGNQVHAVHCCVFHHLRRKGSLDQSPADISYSAPHGTDSQQCFQAALPEARNLEANCVIEEVLDLDAEKSRYRERILIIRPVEYFADAGIGENGV